MDGDVMTFTQGTNPSLSEHQVGIADVGDSAVLVIFDPATRASRRETVNVNSILAIKDDRYCVIAIQRNTISLRKLAK